ncbi:MULTISPECIES: DNA primase [Limosilactobacillus]|uniref:DNA primase n=1 Tax=Limosilactobacillus TaxID=2742598 RepID=UPI00224663AB|nr:DNA primase [Limosilactobacillus pontis]MCX2185984.1 DNA primase [Limosilactobacillus pontis]MCX2187725.1 DNA primase [Limosilactobacillus pontis]
MARIPREIIDQVRNSVDISDVIGQYVQLKRAGKNFTGLCPFHEEQTPSFSVNAEKQFYHCFGCGRSGNVFQFLMDYKHIGFVEAVQEVAKLGGTTLPSSYTADSTPQQTSPVDREQGQLLDLHDKAAQLYHHILFNTPAGEPARRYLQKRGMSRDLIEKFGIGFAPVQRILAPYCAQQKLDYQLMRKSGLFTEDRDGKLQDRFVERVMFPIRNAQGKVIAFSGRLLNTAQTDLPKYLNSPETPIFNKRRTLFNLDLAKKAARDDGRLYLFEGFMDVISAFGAGVENGIASMGTSFTSEQVQIINRTTKQLDICYDGDSAGQNAIDRAISLVQDHQNGRLNVQVVQLPAGVDPDEYVQQNGAAKFREYVHDQEETTTDFYLRFLRNGRNLNNQQELMAYLDAVLKEIARLDTPLAQDMYLSKLADEFKLDKAVLQGQLRQFQGELHLQPTQPAQSYQEQAAIAYAPPAQPTTVKIDRTELAEQILLRYMLHDPNVWSHVRAQDHFHFVHEKYESLYMVASSYFSEYGDYTTARFLDYLAAYPDLRTTLSQVEQLTVNPDVDMQVIDDCLRTLTQQTPLQDQIEQVRAQLKEASTLNNTELATQLTVNLIKLLKKQQQYKAEETK